MSGYYCEECAHGTCFIWTDEISDNYCDGIKKGHKCKPKWIWNAPEGEEDPRYR